MGSSQMAQFVGRCVERTPTLRTIWFST